MATATGRRLCGLYEVVQTRALLLDAEVGPYLTPQRIQRIARAMGVTAEDIGDRLRVAIYPRIALDQPDAEAILTATCAGFGLVILDSLSALSGGAEEHTPEMGKLLIMLGRVSAATGAAIVVLHHTRRDGETRGSTSIYAGAECIWRMVEVDRGQATLRHERSPMGDLQPDLTLAIHDVEVDGDPRAGLAVRVLEPERTAPRTAEASVDDLLSRLVSVVARRPGCSSRTLRVEVGGRGALVDAAADEAERLGKIHNAGTRTCAAYHVGGGPK